MQGKPTSTSFARLRRAFNRLAARHGLSIMAAAAAGFLLPMAYGLIVGAPQPKVHDEFSYLLAADTFAHGRLTNATHPMWRHFESPHVLHAPSYMSKYPPGQGLALAAGQAIFGQPIYGVWLSAAFAAACVSWMLQAWTRPRWALVGTVLWIATIGIGGYWVQSYWGGMVAAAAGALFLGGARRVVGNARRAPRDRAPRAADHKSPHTAPQPIDAALMAAGLVILAISRPFEGMVLAIPMALVLLVWLCSSCRLTLAARLIRVAAPAAVVLGLAAAWLAYYNHRVTHDVWTIPYLAYHRQYIETPLFAFQRNDQLATAGHARIRSFSDWHRRDFSFLYQSIAVPRDALYEQIRFFLPYALATPLLLLPWLLADRWLRLATATWLASAAAMGLVAFYAAVHYMAPAACLAYLLMVEGLRRMRLLAVRGRRAPRIHARWFLAVCFALWLAWDGFASAMWLRQRLAPRGAAAEAALATRRDIAERLAKIGGRHLVIVRYSPDYSVHDEWVYNAADIDNSPIVWAHDLGDEHNRPLLDYFRGHKTWLLSLSSERRALAPYPP